MSAKPEVKALTVAPGMPPPMTFSLDTPLREILEQLYTFSQGLIDNEPTVVLLYADTVQVMWPPKAADEGAGTPAYSGNQCHIRIKFEANSGAGGFEEITPFPFPPY
jgi:hypothetical protein